MDFLRIPFSVTDVAALLVLAAVLAFVVYFVLTSRRTLKAMIEESKRQSALTGSAGRPVEEILKPKWSEKKKLVPELSLPFSVAKTYKTLVATPQKVTTPDAVHELKQSIRQQQKTLDQLLNRVEKLDTAEEGNIPQSVVATQALEEKEAELQKTKQQLSAAQKVAGRVTEVYREFDLLQQKMAELEESAGKTAALASELEEMQQAYDQLQSDLAGEQELLQGATKENQELQQQLAETEAQLNEVTLQRQQLQKRVQLLENLNADLQQVSEANTKLKTELRRIAELESLLSLVSDERDLLLKKRLS